MRTAIHGVRLHPVEDDALRRAARAGNRASSALSRDILVRWLVDGGWLQAERATPKRARRHRRLKVYGGSLADGGQVVLACRSMAEFRAATGITRSFTRETLDGVELALATKSPGTIYVRRASVPDGAWHPLAEGLLAL